MSLIAGTRGKLTSETNSGLMSINEMPWDLDPTVRQGGRALKPNKWMPSNRDGMNAVFNRGQMAKMQQERLMKTGGGIDAGQGDFQGSWKTRGVVEFAPVNSDGSFMEAPVPFQLGNDQFLTQGGKHNRLKIVQGESVEDVLDNVLYEREVAEKSGWLLTRFKNNNYAKSWMSLDGYKLLHPHGTTEGGSQTTNDYQQLGLQWDIYSKVDATPAFIASIPKSHLLYGLGVQKMTSVLEKYPLMITGGLDKVLSDLSSKGFNVPFSTGSQTALNTNTVKDELDKTKQTIAQSIKL
jgi:hypothetical protein